MVKPRAHPPPPPLYLFLFSSPQPHHNSPYFFTMLSVSSPPILTAPTFSARPATQARTRVKLAPPHAFATASTENYTSTSYLPPYHPHYMATAAACSSFYEILGISTGASCQEIKTAYRRLARTCHPDAVLATNRKDSSAGEFMRIHAAYSTLSDPEKRADYDRKLLPRYRPLTATAFSPGYRRRNWETDQCW